MGKVTELPLTGHCNSNADIAAHLRDLAKCVEELKSDELIQNMVIITLFRDGEASDTVIGDPMKRLELAGLYTLMGGQV